MFQVMIEKKIFKVINYGQGCLKILLSKDMNERYLNI